jgi:hypothetical protein
MTDDQDPRLSRPSSKTGRLQRALLRLLAEHQAGGMLPTSGQFLWYELEQAGTVDKTKARGHPGVRRGIDQDANKALTHLRERGVIPWAWIVDETRSTYLYPGARSVLAGARDLLDQVRLDPWDGTPPPLLLVESRSLAGVLRDLAAAYCCDLAATNGQVGGFLHTAVAPRLVPGRRVGYLGDLDLAGRQIEANTRRVLSQYDPGLAAPGQWERLALTEAQVDQLAAEHYGGDRARLVVVKIDGRHKRRGCCPPGHAAVETEALSQQVIVGLVRGWLDALLPKPLAEVLVRERAQRAAVVAALATLDSSGGGR